MRKKPGRPRNKKSSVEKRRESNKRERTPGDVDEVKTEYKEFIIPRWNKVSSVCKH